ncbi:MAG: copper chaperone PCu(A)C [Aquabacterium sp.]|jgi:periplasmic copper chaperone A|uniref:copper chaperone PCu(A)C n=1 Tax=Aquabacterium sp. TaxID=1872578 RepID=UPI003BB02666
MIPKLLNKRVQPWVLAMAAGLSAAVCTAPARADHDHAGGESHAPAAKATTAKPAAFVDVQGAWVRATVPGQSGTGGFMSLRSPTAALQLVGFSTPVAGTAELHEMTMDGNVMRMRPVDGLDLPAGQTVELKPGGHHLMLMALKRPLTAGSTVPLVLRFKTPDGKLLEQKVAVPVRSAAPAGA